MAGGPGEGGDGGSPFDSRSSFPVVSETKEMKGDIRLEAMRYGLVLMGQAKTDDETRMAWGKRIELALDMNDPVAGTDEMWKINREMLAKVPEDQKPQVNFPFNHTIEYKAGKL